MDETKKVVARVIIEMLGSPKEHLHKTMEEYLKTLEENKSVKILSTDIAEPKEQKENLFAQFCELELAFTSLQELFGFCLDSMPASVDVIEPEQIKLNSEDLSSHLNDFLATLHTVHKNYTLINSRSKIIDQNAMRILENFIVYIIRSGKNTAEDIGKAIGLNSVASGPFLEQMEKNGKIKKTGNTYDIA